MNGSFLILFLSLLVTVQVFVSCTPGEQRTATVGQGTIVPLRYAEGFVVTREGNATLVEVRYPHQGATEGYRYLLVKEGDPVPEQTEGATVVRTPVKRLVVTSTTHIPMLDYLGATDRLVGFPTLDYISSEKMRRRIDAGAVTELGVDKGMNLERLAAVRPDLVVGYSLSGDYGQFKKIEELGMPVVINAEYLEKHPLGRAEWIKFMSLFLGKESMADSIFNAIEKAYLETADLVKAVDQRPSVLSGIVYGDGWFLPGGDNYAARLLRDAGCHYLWEDDPSNGFLQLSFETVYARGHDADLWIGVGSFTTRDELEAADGRYARFRPFQTREVYTYNARQGARGGNEYLELGYLRPDLILKDLVKIAHPGRLPEHELFFHKKLP